MSLKEQIQSLVPAAHMAIVGNLSSYTPREDQFVDLSALLKHVFDAVFHIFYDSLEEGRGEATVYWGNPEPLAADDNFLVISGEENAYQVDISPYLIDPTNPGTYLEEFVRVDLLSPEIAQKFITHMENE